MPRSLGCVSATLSLSGLVVWTSPSALTIAAPLSSRLGLHHLPFHSWQITYLRGSEEVCFQTGSDSHLCEVARFYV